MLSIKNKTVHFKLCLYLLITFQTCAFSAGIKDPPPINGNIHKTIHKKLDIPEIKTLIRSKQYSLARDSILTYIKNAPSDPDGYLHLGLIDYQLNNYQSAIISFKKVLQLKPSYFDARILLINCLITRKRYPQALEEINLGLKYSSNKSLLLKKKSFVTQQMILLKKKAETPKLLAIKAKNNKSSMVDIPEIKKIIERGKYKEAKKYLLSYIKKSASDPDGYLHLGIINFKQKNFIQADSNYQKALSIRPNYVDARLLLINSLFTQKKYVQAIEVINTGLSYEPSSQNLLHKKALAYVEMREFRKAIVTIHKIPNFKRIHKLNQLYRHINTQTAYKYLNHFEAGVFQSTMPVSTPNQIWSTTNFYVSHRGPYGTYGVATNYASRLGETGNQYMLYAWPNINNWLGFHFAYAYSNKPSLFANDYYLANAYLYFPRGIELSGGDIYRRISNTNLHADNFSIGKHIGSFFLGIKPILFTPRSGPKSVLIQCKLTKYFSVPDKYIGLVVGGGTAPDLVDLLTVNFFHVRDEFVLLNGQYPISHKILFRYGLGYEEQGFPSTVASGITRGITRINVGFIYRFV